MSEIRYLPILQPDGRQLVDDTMLVVYGAMRFPECARSILHFARVLGDDTANAGGEIRDLDELSVLGKLLLTDVTARNSQGAVTGRVALKLVQMAAHGLEPSMNKAVDLTLKAAQRGEIGGEGFKPGSTSGIRKAFQAHKSACHLWAAGYAHPDIFLAAGSSLEALGLFLAVALTYERTLESIGLPDQWDPWRVPRQFDLPIGVQIPGLSEQEERDLEDYHPALR